MVIAVGAIGCAGYGFWADKIGRSLATISAMAISGLCCLLIGLLQTGDVTWLIAVCLIWGVTVVADSAQFSAAASELCDPQYMGTVLTLQTSIGFLLTMISIRLVPIIQEGGGWAWHSASWPWDLSPVFGLWRDCENCLRLEKWQVGIVEGLIHSIDLMFKKK